MDNPWEILAVGSSLALIPTGEAGTECKQAWMANWLQQSQSLKRADSREPSAGRHPRRMWGWSQWYRNILATITSHVPHICLLKFLLWKMPLNTKAFELPLWASFTNLVIPSFSNFKIRIWGELEEGKPSSEYVVLKKNLFSTKK